MRGVVSCLPSKIPDGKHYIFAICSVVTIIKPCFLLRAILFSLHELFHELHHALGDLRQEVMVA